MSRLRATFTSINFGIAAGLAVIPTEKLLPIIERLSLDTVLPADGLDFYKAAWIGVHAALGAYSLIAAFARGRHEVVSERREAYGPGPTIRASRPGNGGGGPHSEARDGGGGPSTMQHPDTAADQDAGTVSGVPVDRLLKGILRVIETDKDASVLYAANRMQEVVGAQPNGWLAYLDPALPAPLRGRIAKLLGAIDGTSVQDARTAISKARALLLLQGQSRSLEDFIVAPGAPRRNPATTSRLLQGPEIKRLTG